MDIESIAILSS